MKAEVRDYGGVKAALVWSCRLAPVPLLVGFGLLLAASRFEHAWVPAVSMLLCFLAAGMGLSGLFGAARLHSLGLAEKRDSDTLAYVIACGSIFASFVLTAACVGALGRFAPL